MNLAKDGQIMERVGFGSLILGGYILSMGTLAFFPIPEGNRELFSQGVGALGAAVGVIVAAIWRASVTEVRQAEAIQTMAAANAAPTTTTTTITRDAPSGQATDTSGNPAGAGGAGGSETSAPIPAYVTPDSADGGGIEPGSIPLEPPAVRVGEEVRPRV